MRLRPLRTHIAFNCPRQHIAMQVSKVPCLQRCRTTFSGNRLPASLFRLGPQPQQQQRAVVAHSKNNGGLGNAAMSRIVADSKAPPGSTDAESSKAAAAELESKDAGSQDGAEAEPQIGGSRRKGQQDQDGESFRWNIHGRHMDITPEIEQAVRSRLQPTLQRLERGVQFVEAWGGVADVDVKLMASEATVRLHPVQPNKSWHDTFLQQGELKAHGQGGSTNWNDNFELACQQLERKLHPNEKAPVSKKDQRRSF